MASTIYITIEEFSTRHGVDKALIREFMDFGLVTAHPQQEGECLTADDTEHVARLIRLYRDLGINKEGIDIIIAMREQLIHMSKELEAFKYKAQRLEQEKQLLFFDVPRNNGLLRDADDF